MERTTQEDIDAVRNARELIQALRNDISELQGSLDTERIKRREDLEYSQHHGAMGWAEYALEKERFADFIDLVEERLAIHKQPSTAYLDFADLFCSDCLNEFAEAGSVYCKNHQPNEHDYYEVSK